jgi:hypothetical protein
MNKIYNYEGLDMLSFKLILNLNDNWEEYKKNDKYKVRDVEIKEVEKMLGCMDIEKGYNSYICQSCGEIIYIPHSCKSRICTTCGKKHADEWAEMINSEMYAVPYRHIILTVSDKLWVFFEGNSMMQKVMLETASKVMKAIVSGHNGKNKEVEPGIIMVLHPFGRDLKTNMHVHMLMTEGGLTKEGEWISKPYLDYGIIRKTWQYEILTAMRKAMPGNRELKKRVRETMGKLGKLVKHVINSFSWRKHIIEYTGKDPLQCMKCGGEMKLFEIAYRNKDGELKKYGGISLLLKKLGLREVYEFEKEAESKEKEKNQYKEEQKWHQLCMF